MKLRYRLLLILVPVLAGAAVWFTCSNPEPAYQGKPLSRWIAEIRAGRDSAPYQIGPSRTQREAVQAMGLEALPPLLESVRPRNYQPWWPATYRRCYESLPTVLRELLPVPARSGSENEAVFQWFVGTHCQLLRPEAEPLLIRTLRHARPEVRATAAAALGGLTNSSPMIFTALTNCFRDPDVEVRRCVVDAISCFGPAASNAVPAIVENLRLGGLTAQFQPSANEQAWAAIALGKIGSGAFGAVPVLREGAVQRTNSYFRVTSSVALWRIRHQASEALPALSQEFVNFDRHMKWMILSCFDEMGTEAAEAIPSIVTFLRSVPDPTDPTDNHNRRLTLETLRRIAPDVAAKREREIEQLRRE